VRRTVATLLVVASPVLMVVPADAGDVPVVVPTVVPAAPAPLATVVPAVPEAPAPPAVAAPAAAAPAVPAPAQTVVRPVVKTVRASAPTRAAADDAAYSARLQADLCEARAIFCGLDRGGHYPAG
jgi:hypothetical protein